ncbi:AraC family transcriptional regulator [Mycobacteroides chelonae]|nr:AraC family transcriptional regulator [Mycobacteroides chelonae]
MGGNDMIQANHDNEPPNTNIVAEIGLIVYPNCQMSAIYGLTDIFRVASDYASKDGRGPAHAVRVSHWTPTDERMGCVFDSHPEAGEHHPSYLISPPSLVVPQQMKPADNQLHHWLKHVKSQGTTLCGVCAGVFVLAEAGMLDNRDATTHWAFAEELARRYPKIRVDSSRMVIDAVDIITAAGILAWVDLGLTLVERLLGPSVMLHTSRFILADPPRRQQSLYREFVPPMDHGDADILRAQNHIHSHSDNQLPIEHVAEIAQLQPRTLQRRFLKATGMSLAEYLLAIRIAEARELLELTTLSVEQISRDVGYRDVSTFRKTFKRTTSITPTEYRNRFGIVSDHTSGSRQNR